MKDKAEAFNQARRLRLVLMTLPNASSAKVEDAWIAEDAAWAELEHYRAERASA